MSPSEMDRIGLAYLAARRAEGRLLEDEVVRGLPESGRQTIHSAEWRVRKGSLATLLRLMAKARQSLRVLDVGCGNGWMSAQLAKAGHPITAIDTNQLEIGQAARVFGSNVVRWIRTDPYDPILGLHEYDRIIFAASLHYFADLTALIARCDELLVPDGEIHVLDSRFYASSAKRAGAAERTRHHFEQIGVPDMISHYHHHTWEDLRTAASHSRMEIQHPPTRWSWILGAGGAFPYVVLHR